MEVEQIAWQAQEFEEALKHDFILTNNIEDYKPNCILPHENPVLELSRPTKYYIEVTNEKKKSFQCLNCSRIFGSIGPLRRHNTIVHEGKMPFECPVCQMKLPSKSAMDRHVAFVHERKKPFECSICLAKFVYKSILNQHTKVVHNGKWKCSECITRPTGTSINRSL